jgi:hypothetical protein
MDWRRKPRADAGAASTDRAGGAASLRASIGKQTVRRPFRDRFLPPIENAEDARGCVRMGAYAGLALAGMYVIGAVAIYVFGTDFQSDAIPPQDVASALIGIAIVLPIVLFLTWRVSTGKGFISSALLLLLFLFELFVKFTSQTFVGPFWIFAYIAIVLGFVNGIRGCLALRRLPKEPAADIAATFS